MIGLNIYLASYDMSDPENSDYGNKVTDTQFYFIAALLFVLSFALTIVYSILLKRLKLFYPNFYKKEKKKVK